MPDSTASFLAPITHLTRRNLIGAAAGGALLGSAWAAELRNAVTAGDTAQVTMARTATAFGALFEYRGHRIMLADAADEPGIDTVSELVTGLMRQRIDAVMLTPEAAAAMPREYLSQWKIRDVWTLPGTLDDGPSTIAGKLLGIDDFAITVDAVPNGAWRADAPEIARWYVAAGIGRAQVVIVSDGDAVSQVPLNPTRATAVVCFDVQFQLDALPAGVDALAVPAEVADGIPDGAHVIPLSQDESTTLRLQDDQITGL